MEEETGLGVAARCWCDPETEDIEMDVKLATAFGRRASGYLGIIETAWGVIANAGQGDWERESPEWKEAAERWRQLYHDMLDRHGDPV